jgi:hypothetical protein
MSSKTLHVARAVEFQVESSLVNIVLVVVMMMSFSKVFGVVSTRQKMRKFQRNINFPSSGLKCFRPEDGDSKLLRNIGRCRRVHIESKSKTTILSSVAMKNYNLTQLGTHQRWYYSKQLWFAYDLCCLDAIQQLRRKEIYMILGDLYLRLNMKVKKSGSLKEYTK